MKTRFFSNITHEFRTPLSLIIAPLEQLHRENGTPHSIKKTVDGVRRNARQLLRLINQLLDMSKIEAGNMTVFLVRGNPGLFIANHTKGFEAQARQKNIRLIFDNRLRGEYDFDADKWQKILVNLLSNAMKFTPPGGLVKVSLNANYADNILHSFQLEVKDSGIGIPREKIPYIFNRFYQVDDSRTRAHGGTGIGLALVKELAELMKGKVTVESEPGNGTLFRVLIPAEITRKTNREAARKLPARRAEQTKKPVGGKDTPLILLAEDNEELNDFIRRSLGGSYQVITAFSGKEALRMAKEHLPDLVISDIMMPEMDGYSLCRELKEAAETDHIALVLLSAKASHESVIKGLENHADDYITKPFHIDELQLRVHNLIDRQLKLREHYNRQLTAPGEQLQPHSVRNLFLKRLYTVIETHLDDPQLDVGMLAGKMNISRRTLNRKLSTLVNLSASEVVKQYRLKKAIPLLQSGLNVSEVAYQVGFRSVSYFSNSFKEFYGVVPSAYAHS